MGMNNYEVMLIIKPDLNEEQRQAAMKTIKDLIVKTQGKVLSDEVWAERRRLAYDLFPIGGGTRIKEGLYYLVRFESAPSAIDELKKNFGLNENILRSLILRIEAVTVPAAA
jgi:small subunit ribosomal protein S6